MIQIRIRCDHCHLEQRWTPSDGQPIGEIAEAIRESTGISRVTLDVGNQTRVMDLCERCVALHGDCVMDAGEVDRGR